ncbi:ribonuclease P protein component 4 [Halomicrobium urmianum]|uniref:ribonuclease P protein component 4 n=1 Tax=Halomicrobium urmianum TaxID=1586233 RepID=UPI001CD9C871|nr:ribonuclease P [Halomicrobium urmianum]
MTGRETEIARERVERLQDLARAAAADSEDDRAREYVRRARRVAERNRLRLPRSFERFTCDACDAYLRPGRNARVRTQGGHVVITCDCGAQSRYPYE